MKLWHIKQSVKTAIGSKKLEPNTLVINCSPRSGSTWLLDCLRCHPSISITRGHDFFNAFPLFGRRYPADLSNPTGVSSDLEVLPGKVESIPIFRMGKKPHHSELPQFAIEKIHPEFYRFRTERLIEKIENFKEKGHQFKFVLLARHPSGAFRSFLQYQSRNPKWYDEINEKKLLENYRKTYQSILDFKENYGGLCLKYDDFQKHPVAFLSQIYDYIWGADAYPDLTAKKADIKASLNLTSREKRQASGTSFLGKKAGKAMVGAAGLKLKLRYEADREKYDLCVDIYEKIIA